MTDTVAALGIEVDSSQAAIAAKILDALVKAASGAAKGVDDLNKSSNASKAGVGALNQQIAVIQRQMIALAGNLGLVGTLMAGMGSAGLVAAAGIGGLVAVFTTLSDRANALGQTSIELAKFSSTTGLTAEQLQVVNIEAAKFGMTGEEAGTRITRFTQQVKELHDANGPLFEIILKVDQAIAKEMTTTTSGTKMLELYAQARIKANSADRARMDLTAFGRGGQVFGSAIGSMADQGGISKMADEMDRFGILSNNDVEVLGKMKVAIDEIGKRNKTAMDLWFSQDVLMRESQAALLTQRILKAIQDMSGALPAAMAASGEGMAAYWTEVSRKALEADKGLGTAEERAKRLLALQLQLGQRSNFTGTLTYMPNKAEQATADFASELNMQNRLVAALGAGATARDQYTQQLLAMKKAFSENQAPGRSLIETIHILDMTFNAQKIQANVSALGQLATVSQTVAASMAQIALQQAKGQTTLSPEQMAMIRTMQQFQAEGAQLQVRQANIVVSADELMIQKKHDLMISVFNGTMTIKQANEAISNYSIHARDAAEATQVYASKFPQLTQAMLDATNPFKTMDTFGVSTINHLSDTIVSLNDRSKSFGETMTSLGLTVVKEFEKMIIQAMIFRSIAPFFGGGGFNFLSLFSGSGGTTVGTSSTGNVFIPISDSLTGGGFAGGGYTGDVGGIVHKREFVINSDATARFRPLLEAINRGIPGYEDGGYVGSSYLSSSWGRTPVINIYPTAGSTFDQSTDASGAIRLVERRIDDKLSAFSRQVLPGRVAQINADPRAYG